MWFYFWNAYEALGDLKIHLFCYPTTLEETAPSFLSVLLHGSLEYLILIGQL